jgi:hypothetical protein
LSADNETDRFKTSIITGAALDRYFDLHDMLLEFGKLFSYDDDNDRAIAIVGATFLEALLEHILRAFLVDDEKEVGKLFEPNQPLSTFSGKIALVYSLGLIYEPVYRDLHVVRKIRNEFAHDLYASFENDKIKSWCWNLQWHRIAYVSTPPPEATPRDFFQVGVNQLVTYLHGVVGIARFQQRKVERHY